MFLEKLLEKFLEKFLEFLEMFLEKFLGNFLEKFLEKLLKKFLEKFLEKFPEKLLEHHLGRLYLPWRPAPYWRLMLSRAHPTLSCCWILASEASKRQDHAQCSEMRISLL